VTAPPGAPRTGPEKSAEPGPATAATRGVRVALVAALVLSAVPWTPPLAGTVAASGAAAAIRAIPALVVGATVPLALAAARRPAWMEALVVAGALAAAALIRDWGSAILAVPLLVAIGLWAWQTARVAVRSTRRALLWAGAGVAVAALVPPILLAVLLESRPRITEVPPITPEDRARLEQMLRVAGDRADEPSELRFDTADLTGIAAAWLGARSSPAKVTFSGAGDRLTCELSAPLPDAGAPRFLNLRAEMRPRIAGGSIDPGLVALRIGPVDLPAVVVPALGRLVAQSLRRIPEAGRLVDTVDELSFESGSMVIVADADRAAGAFADSMASSSGASARMRDNARAIMRALVVECEPIPPGDGRFEALLRAAFRIAGDRSGADDHVEQNRAALVALGIQIGDPRVRRVAGFPATEEMPAFPWLYDARTTLRGRNDLARHFLVSAALRALSTRDFGMTMGLFKEQLDAVDGGSGFSFADIAADMAGLRLADHAIDPRRAARLQREIQDDASADTLLPSLEGLSENLSQAEFATRYGSPSDDRYHEVIRLIEARMESCAHLATTRPPGGRGVRP